MTSAIDRRALLTLGTLLAAGSAFPASAQEPAAHDQMHSMMAAIAFRSAIA